MAEETLFDYIDPVHKVKHVVRIVPGTINTRQPAGVIVADVEEVSTGKRFWEVPTTALWKHDSK